MVCIHMHKLFSVVGSYVPYSSATNGRRGQFGILNVKSGEDAVVRFKFVNADTRANVLAPPFLCWIYERDCGKIAETVYEFVEVSGYNGLWHMRRQRIGRAH